MIVLCIINLFTFFVFLSSVHYAYKVYSLNNILQILLLLIEFIVFDVSIIGLIYAKNISAFLLLAGTIILVIGDFFLTYTYISQTTVLFFIGELLWFLGLLFLLFTALSIKENKHYDFKEWFRSDNAIKSRLGFGVFLTSILGFLLTFAISYLCGLISQQVFIVFPPCIMIYSVIGVTLSLFIARSFEEPFKKIQSNINKMVLEADIGESDNNLSIEEFIILNKYLLEAFKYKEEQYKIRKQFGNLATQVVHNIRTPITVIDNLLESMKSQIPQHQRHKINEQLNQIRQTADNFLDNNRTSMYQLGNINEPSYCILKNIMNSVIEQKRIEWRHSECNIRIVSHLDKIIWLNVFEYEFKNLLSNLLNNAYEAMPTQKQEIEICLENISNSIKISIKDHGIGIPNNEVEHILNGKSLKPSGNGIGLSSANSYIKSLNGQLNLYSKQGIGTTVEIILPEIKLPLWAIQKIELPIKHKIAVVDDDSNVHTIWQIKLFTTPLNFLSFYNGEDFTQWYNSLEDKQNVTVIMDYNLHNDALTGLDILIALQVRHAILITCCSEQGWLQSRIEETSYSMVSKLILNDIPVVINNP